MPDKLTDLEVVKALECCAYSEGCEQCPRSKECDGQEHFRYALDLINRLRAEKAVLNRKLTDAYLMIDKLKGD